VRPAHERAARPAQELSDAELRADLGAVFGRQQMWPAEGKAPGRGGRPAALILPSAGPRRWLSSLLRRGAR